MDSGSAMMAGLCNYYNGHIPQEVMEGLMADCEVEPDMRTSKEKCIDTLKELAWAAAMIVNCLLLFIPMIIYFAAQDAAKKNKERKIAQINRQKYLVANEKAEVERVEREVASQKKSAQKVRQRDCLVDLRGLGNAYLKSLQHEAKEASGAEVDKSARPQEDVRDSVLEASLARASQEKADAQWWDNVTSVAKGALFALGIGLMAWKSPETLRKLVTDGVTIYPR